MTLRDRQNHDTYIRSYLRTGNARVIGTGRDVTGRRKDGATVPLRLSVVAVQAMCAGAVDFLEKPVSRERLPESVGRATDVDRSVRRDERERSEIGTRLRDLTTRERQVLERLVLGRTNKLVARELGISSRTIEVYRRNVMMKMGADSLSHLVRMTLVAGIDPVGSDILSTSGST